MNLIQRLFSIFGIALVLVSGGCDMRKSLSPDQTLFRQEARKQIEMLQSLLAPVMAKAGGNKAIDGALSQYFSKTGWKKIACDFEVRVVDGQKRYIGGRVHLKNWDGSLPGPDTRLNYSQYGQSFNRIGEGKIFSGRFFNSDGPLVIIGAPIYSNGRGVGAFGIFLPGQCIPKHFGLEQDDILDIDYN